MTDNLKSIVEDCLPWFRPSSLARTYVLGSFGRRVTFLSQQTRACNLIALLYALQKLQKNSKVCIVGAGLAGLTAAAMAVRAGANVTLIEQAPGPLTMQLGNFVRFIHPRILTWPTSGSEEAETDLPVLNWRAASAETVAQTILAEWNEQFAPHVNFIPNAYVTAVSERNSDATIHFQERGVDQRRVQQCSIAILAVGFGWEKTIPGIGFRSYWSNDALHQQFPVAERPVRMLVSGTGDGGLIDTLRLTLRNFDQSKFTERVYGHAEFEQIRQAIVDIETNIAGDGEPASDNIRTKYEELDSRIPDAIKVRLFNDIRSDVQVYLNGRHSHPVDVRASALHRLTIFLLWKKGRIVYEQGDISTVTGSPGRYLVNLRKPGDHWQLLEFDECIIRHGPVSAIRPLISKSAGDELYDRFRSSQEDPTIVPLWKRGLKLPRTRGSEQVWNRRLEATRLRDQAAEIIGPQSILTISVQGDDNDLHYRVELATSSGSSELPDEVLGTPVKYLMTKFEGKQRPDPNKLPLFARLGLGAPLLNASRGPEHDERCSLGCFVYLDTGEIGFITTGHNQKTVFVNRGDTVAWASRLFDKDTIPVGTGLVATELSKSRPDDLIFNVMDISLVKLLPGVPYSPGFAGKAGNLQIDNCVAPSMGDKVFKIGAATGMTEGTIVSVKMRLRLNLHNPAWFEGAFEIAGEDGELFSNVGDSGAIIFKQLNETTAAVVGMIFAGAGRSTYGFPLQPSLEALRCRLFTGGEPPTSPQPTRISQR